MRTVLERLSAARCASFLAVLKRFEHDSGGCSASRCAGWTLTLDIPAAGAELGDLLDGLDELVVEAGGRVYLTKDSRSRPELLAGDVPELDRWREVRARLDPHAPCCAATWTGRLGLTGAAKDTHVDEGRPRFRAVGPRARRWLRHRARDVRALARRRGARASCSRRASPRRSIAAVAELARRRRVRGRHRRLRRDRLRDARAVRRRTTFDRFGDFDVVLVAFGVLGDQARAEPDAAAALEIVQTNFTGVVSVTVPLVERLEEQGHGTIVLLSSVAGERVRRSNFVYGSSKAGVDAFYQGLGDRLAGSGVHVMIVRPGFVHDEDDRRHEARAAVDHPGGRGATRSRAGSNAAAPPCGCRPTLRFVMSGLRHLPRPVFRRLDI